MRLIPFIIFFALFLQSLILWPIAVYSEESQAGKITKVEGKVTVLRDETKEIDAIKDMPLYEGDTIITGESGKAWFSLEQGSDFQLAPDTQIAIDELSSSEFEDETPTLRLILGYLWSKLRKIRSNSNNLEIHTPTAVIGIRGTEFDTVVSLDTSTVIAVDEGSVQVDSLDEKHVLQKDKMVQIDADIKKVSPVAAIPKAKRDWNAWQKERAQRLYLNLPKISQRLRDRFQIMADGSIKFMSRLKTEEMKVDRAIRKFRTAKDSKSRKAKRQALDQLKTQVDRYKKLAGDFRKKYNRVKVIGKSVNHLREFLSKNRDKFSDKDLDTIDSNFEIIDRNLKKMRSSYRQAIQEIRKTFRKLKKVRQEINKNSSSPN